MNEIGQIKDIEIDPETRAVTGFIVGVSKQMAQTIVGGRLRIRGGRVRVPIAQVDKLKDAVILKLDVNELRGHVESA
jgi:sporulation protein YlmC with PRC-barrel domain